MKKTITFCGQSAIIECDERCDKAWGRNSRPTRGETAGGDPDYLTDEELGEAPADPGTYEGRDGKPTSPDQIPNKWCARECERCTMREL